jgi:DNA-binding IclR family transcriptional regulator
MTASETASDDAKRSVLGRAFDILDCFTTEQPEQTIASLCDQTGLPPATVHRMLAGLVEWEAVERTSRGRYRLGRRLWKLGWSVTAVKMLRDAARPFMADLYSATGELVALGTRDGADGKDVVILDFTGGLSVSKGWHSGRRVPLLASGPGLVYLAHATPDTLRSTLSQVCPTTWSGADDFELRQRLSEVKRTGVAVMHGRKPNTSAWVSAPIYSHDGSVRSTLSIVVPEDRLNAVSMSRVVSATARGITETMTSRRQRRGAVCSA